MNDLTRSSAPTTVPPQARRPRIDRDATVNEVIRQHPAAVAVLNAFGVDACCGGAAPLGEAALHAGVALAVLLEALEGAVCRCGGTDACGAREIR